MRTSITIAAMVFLLVGLPTAHSQSKLSEIEIPNKLGFGLSIYNQEQPYQIKSLELGVPGLEGDVLENLPVDNRTVSTHVRIDYWLLPFLNVFGLMGQIDSTTEVNLRGFDIGLPTGLDNLSIDIDGTVYGAGLVLAVGGKSWFGAVAYDYTTTDLDVASSTIEAQIVTPKIGLHFDGGAVWIGAMYQDVEETHEGIYDLPFLGEVPYKVVLEGQEPWNYMIGGVAGLSEHFVLILQGGFGSRKSALVTLEYRIF